MNKYFIARNGEKVGPFTLEELRQKTIARNDLIWYKGMSDWTRAHQIAELADLFPAQASAPPPQNTPRSSYQPQEKKIPKLIGLMILSIFGIVASLVQISFGFFYLASQNHSYSWVDDGDCWYTESKLDTAYQVGGSMALIFGIFLLILSIVGIVSSARRIRVAN